MSMQNLLRKNDIIRLEKGMTVYAFIPEKFSRCSHAPFSNELTSIPIEIGEILYKHIFLTKEAFTEMITEQIQSLIKSDCITEEKVSNFIDSLGLNFSPEEFDTSVFEGEYHVYKVSFGGNNTERNDFRDYHTEAGWHVFCEKVNNPDVRVHFFQTGKLATISCDIKPIRHEK